MSVKRLQTLGSSTIEQLAASTQREFDNVYRNITAAEYTVAPGSGLTMSGRQIGTVTANATQTGMLLASDWVRFNNAALPVAGTVSAIDRANWDAAYNHSLIVAGNPHQVTLSEVLDPTIDKLFSMGTKHLALRFTNPSTGGGYDGAFEIDGIGNFTGDLLHIHQSAGNSSSAQDIVHIEVNAVASSANPLRVSTSAGDALLIPIDRSIELAGPVKIGTNPAGAGMIRLPNAQEIRWRNAANSADSARIGTDGVNDLYIQALVAARLIYIQASDNSGIAVSAGMLLPSGTCAIGAAGTKFTNAFLSGYVHIGTNVSTDANAVVRLENTKQIGWRNAANSGNIGLLVDGSNRLYVNAAMINEQNTGGFNQHEIIYSGTRAANDVAQLALGLTSNAQKYFSFAHAQVTSADNNSQLLLTAPDGSNIMSFQRNKDVYAYASLYVTTQVRAGNTIYLYIDPSTYWSVSYDANNFYNYAYGKALYFGTGTAAKALVFVAEGVGVASFTSTAFSITPSTTIANVNSLGSYTYTSGYFGAGWRMGYDASQGHTLEVDNLIVRNTLRAFIFQKDIVRASNGYLLISDASEIVATTQTSDSPLYIYTKEDVFQAGDLVWYKDIDETTGLVVTGIKINITAVGGSVALPVGGKNGYRYTYTVSSGSGSFKVGGVVVRVGSSVAGRQGSIYFDSSTPTYAPFMDIYDGVASWSDFSSTAKTKARLGKLTGITSSAFGPLAGYGLYTYNAYLEGDAFISGTLTAGWSNGIANAFYAGKIVTNLVNESQNLSTTPWTVSLGTITRTANDVVAPDGTTTGTKLVLTSTPAYMQGSTATLTNGVIYVVSMWLRSSYSGGSIYIKLNQGTSQTLISSTPSDSVWRRYSVPVTAGGGTAGIELQLFPSGATFWIWGVQIEAATTSNTPSPYQRTDGTLTDYTTGGMWARRGGFGRSMQNPAIWLTDSGLELKASAAAAANTTFLIGRELSARWSETGIKGFMGLYNLNDHAIIRFRSTADNTGEVQISSNPNGHCYFGMYDGTRYAVQMGTFRAFDGTTAATTMGIRVYDSSGNVVFNVNNTGEALISGWSITTTDIRKYRGTTPDKGMSISCGDGTYMPTITVVGNSNGPTYLSMGGYLYDGTWRNDYWGMVIRVNSNNLFRCYYGPIAGSPTLTADIAGWSFDINRFYKGSVAIESNTEKFVAGNSGSDASGTGIRAVFGKFNGTDYGIRCWDGTTTYFQFSSSTSAKQNTIAGFFFDSSRIWSGKAVVGSYYRHISMNNSNARIEFGYSLTQDDSAFTIFSWIGWNGSITGLQVDSQYITFQQGTDQVAVTFKVYGQAWTHALLGLSGTPTATWSTGAGTTTPTGITINGSNLAGKLTFTTSSGPVVGLVCTLTFANSGYLGNLNPYVVLMAGNTAAALRATSWYVTTNSTVFYIYTGTTALAASTQYILHWHVIG